MPSRKDLNDIAYGVVQSFISRNNDLSGYWAIGKLYLAAKESGSSAVELDLMQMETSLSAREFRQTIQHYRTMLDRLLNKKMMTVQWVKKCIIVASFNQDLDKRYHYFQSPIGQPYICTITITDDLGREHSMMVGGFCRPHDPLKEIRSNRFVEEQF